MQVAVVQSSFPSALLQKKQGGDYKYWIKVEEDTGTIPEVD